MLSACSNQEASVEATSETTNAAIEEVAPLALNPDKKLLIDFGFTTMVEANKDELLEALEASDEFDHLFSGEIEEGFWVIQCVTRDTLIMDTTAIKECRLRIVGFADQRKAEYQGLEVRFL